MAPILLTLVAFSLAHVSLMAFWSWALRAGIAEVSVGMGPRVARLGKLSLKLVPLGGQVRYLDGQLGERAGSDTQTYDALPFWKRIALPVAPLVTLMLVCWAALGDRAWPAFVGGFEQWFRGALGPLSAAQVLLARLADVCASEPPIIALGLVFSKLCALNTLGAIVGPGGSLIAHTLAAIGVGERQLVAAQYLGLLVLCCIALPWMIAVAWFAWTRLG